MKPPRKKIDNADQSVAEKLEIDSMSAEDRGFCKALILCCAHASLIGGTAIITSTGPNLVFRENIQNRYPDGQITMTYLEWMVFAFPPMILYLSSSYLILTCYFMGPKTLIRWFKKENAEKLQINRNVEKNIRQMYEDLGEISFGEMSVGCFFVILIGSWISRDPGFTSGWADLLEHRNYLTDSAIGILIAAILFVWPKNLENLSQPILEWSDMKSKYSWSCTLLIGAGYAISEGVFKSGLARMISCGMKSIFLNLSPLPLQVCVTVTIVIMTEFASNVSTGSIFIPISLGVAESMGVHPLYLSLPTTVACSFAFMLPISTPPNAIVYDTRVISMIDMIACGFLLNIACILITTLNMNSWTYLVFGLTNFPENLELGSSNSTLLSC
ncbi:unnamed protein product [Caenorhabditis angaria]|uniref:Uncharacterized protein n=1 Tax=Caenorhabditis angaria TaxID=860376 RepID=A0A9P1IHN2_9PELO|nr:unnamed protein product [Caenorhabditis angaria]